MVFLKRFRCFALLLALAAILPALSCIPTDEIAWLGFSADGRYLGCAKQDGLLTVVDLETREKVDVTDQAVAGGFEWSPAGNRLIFCVKRDDAWDLALLDVGGTVTRVTRDRWRDFQPTWSPDGRGVYFVSSRGGGFQGDYDIRYLELESGQSYPVISGPHDQTDPRISQDGRWLAAVSYRDGNPIVLVYGVKSMRVIQIPLPPDYRGQRLSLLQWTRDCRRLLCEIRSRDRFHLVECDRESEEWRTLESSASPFDAVCANATHPDLVYVTGGKAYRRRAGSRWGRRCRVSLGDLPVTRLAGCPSDGRFGVAVAGNLVGVASRSGRRIEPLFGIPEESLVWGDVEIQRGHRREGLRHYEAAFDAFYARHGERGDEAVALARLSRAPLLCRYGHTRQCLSYLKYADRVLGDTLDQAVRDELYAVLALAQFVGNGNEAAARSWMRQIPDARREGVLSGKTDLMQKILDHPEPAVRRASRRAIAELWRGDTERGLGRLENLVETHPADPVTQAVYRQALRDRFALPQKDVFELKAPEDEARGAVARSAVRFPEIVGDAYEMDREWFELLAGAYLVRGDANGLGRLVLQHGRKFMDREAAVGAYRQYWQPVRQAAAGDPVAEETLAMVLFDPAILDLVYDAVEDPRSWTDVNLARARRALVGGDYEDMKTVLGAVAAQIGKRGKRQLLGDEPDREAAYTILQAGLAEREGAWVQAVQRYREASRIIEGALKRTADDEARRRLERLLEETRFRAELFQRGPSARGEVVELLTIERGVGDGLMTHSTDPTSLANGIHNFFAMLSRVGTPWVVDLVYFKAGQSYRLLGRWGEAAFCLRVAARSREPFVARRANAELVRLYRELEDGGLAAWYDRRK